MKIWKFPDQVIRLAVLFIAAVVALIVVRQLLVPKSFGAVGHYRAHAVELSVNRELKYAGWQICVDCHDGEVEAKNRSYHRTLSCEVCHGPSAVHANAPDEQLPVVPRRRGESCLYCHSYLASRPTGFPQVIEQLHNPLKPCIGCHDPHDPTPPETPENCSGCHAEIARTKAISHHASLECETCHEAAPEHKSNPRAFLPKRPSANEFCGQCHARDAEISTEIPRIDLATHAGRYLCWQCHYPHFPEH